MKHFPKKRPPNRPRVGLALSGGGPRGAAHIGVLKVLCDYKIPIDLIAGTSAGAIVAALYASGYSPSDMKAELDRLKLNELIDFKLPVSEIIKHGVKTFFKMRWSSLPQGFIKGDKIEQYLGTWWQDCTVRNTRIPVAITAVDLNTGDTVFFTTPLPSFRKILNAKYFHNTRLVDAVRASISIPGVFFPKKYKGMTLVDGAVKNNLPSDILRQMGAEYIIGVDLGYDGSPNYQINTVGEILMQCIDIMNREVTLLKGEHYSDIVIRPATQDISSKDKRRFMLYVERGEMAARSAVNQIKADIGT
ncbi:MAG: patatin-like phospholipase family protein [Negativicutes bacterium]|nr:patatin-like phospholipase family protein [Negativicutes bacterium]